MTKRKRKKIIIRQNYIDAFKKRVHEMHGGKKTPEMIRTKI
jgi:hypothetical protein